MTQSTPAASHAAEAQLAWQHDRQAKRPAYTKRRLPPRTALAPTPAVILSSRGEVKEEDGTTRTLDNLCTVAWTGIINSDPPMLSVSLRRERLSWSLIRASREFVVNLVDRPLAIACDYCGTVSGRDRNKAEDLGLTFEPASGLDGTQALVQSPVTLSCKVARVIPLGSHDLILAHIVAVEAATTLLDDKGHLDMGALDLIAYAGQTYQPLGNPVAGRGDSVQRMDRLSTPEPRRAPRDRGGDKARASRGRRDGDRGHAYDKRGRGPHRAAEGRRGRDKGRDQGRDGDRPRGRTYDKRRREDRGRDAQGRQARGGDGRGRNTRKDRGYDDHGRGGRRYGSRPHDNDRRDTRRASYDERERESGDDHAERPARTPDMDPRRVRKVTPPDDSTQD